MFFVKKMIFFFSFLSLFLFPTFSFSLSADHNLVDDPSEFISVTFYDASLSDLVVFVSEQTGSSFVLSTKKESSLTWSEVNIKRDSLLTSFRLALVSSGYSVTVVPGKNDLYVIKDSGSATSLSPASFGTYKLRYIDPSVVSDFASKMYPDSLSVSFIESSGVVIFSGSSEVVRVFSDLLSRVDLESSSDLAAFKLHFISVSSALKALTDLKVFSVGSFYGDSRTSSVFCSGTEKEKEFFMLVLSALDIASDSWGDEVFYYHGENISKVVELLSSVLPKITFYQVSESRFLASGPRSEVNRVPSLLSSIDGSGYQVRVEAVISYMTDKEVLDIGSRVYYSDSRSSLSAAKSLPSSLIASPTGLLVDFFTDFGFSFSSDHSVDHGTILSSPVLTVMSGKEASIHVGQNVPYLSQANYDNNDGTSTATSIERKDVGLSFSVKPVVEDSGRKVSLYISQELSSLSGSSDAVDVIFDTNSLVTNISLENGGFIFLGGLRSSEDSAFKSDVPFLSEIPFLGRFLGSRSDTGSFRHLVVALRVFVLDDFGNEISLPD